MGLFGTKKKKLPDEALMDMFIQTLDVNKTATAFKTLFMCFIVIFLLIFLNL